jgi:hypothetical protein
VSGAVTDLVVTAKPIRTGRIANASAAFALIVFVVVALVMRRDNAGAYFGQTDQIFTVVIGLIVAGGLRLPARPRVRADLGGVHMRSYVGNWRTIPWDAVVAVEFPSNVRFARLRLPAEETLAIYAVQRMDREHAVEAMRGLRTLFAATHPDTDSADTHAPDTDAG